MIHIGNAPCSWGSLEFEGVGENKVTFEKVLNEIEQTGYTGTELGDWGFMPSKPKALKAELAKRKLTLTGAFVPVAFRRRDAHDDGKTRAVKTARLMANTAQASHAAGAGAITQPFLVLADDNGSDARRTLNAGNTTPGMGLSEAEWSAFADGVNAVAAAVKIESGLRCVFHHHCAGFIERPEEMERLMALTDPDLVGLVFDTGHYAFGSTTPTAQVVMDGLRRFADRIWYVHLKDCSAEVAAQARKNHWDYFTSVSKGVFCELGKGCVPFADVARWMRDRDYAGFATVEQDVLPGMGAPAESAKRNRAYLRSIGL